MCVDADSKWDGLKDAEEGPALPKANVVIDDDDGAVAHQCLLTAQQVEEIYVRTYKGEHEGESKAKNLETWRRENGMVPFLRAPAPEMQGNPGTGWQVLSLDTRRFYKFQWKKIECRSQTTLCASEAFALLSLSLSFPSSL